MSTTQKYRDWLGSLKVGDVVACRTSVNIRGSVLYDATMTEFDHPISKLEVVETVWQKRDQGRDVLEIVVRDTSAENGRTYKVNDQGFLIHDSKLLREDIFRLEPISPEVLAQWDLANAQWEMYVAFYVLEKMVRNTNRAKVPDAKTARSLTELAELLSHNLNDYQDRD